MKFRAEKGRRCGSEWGAKHSVAPQDPFLGALLTAKPRLVVLNVDMDSAGGGNEKSAFS